MCESSAFVIIKGRGFLLEILMKDKQIKIEKTIFYMLLILVMVYRGAILFKYSCPPSIATFPHEHLLKSFGVLDYKISPQLMHLILLVRILFLYPKNSSNSSVATK